MEALNILPTKEKFQIETILDELKRLSIAFTNHIETDRADFKSVMEEMKITQAKFIELMVDIKSIKTLLGWVRSIAGIIGGIIAIDVGRHFIK